MLKQMKYCNLHSSMVRLETRMEMVLLANVMNLHSSMVRLETKNIDYKPVI